VEHALEIVKNLRQNGIKPSTASLNAIMSANAERGAMEFTLFMLQQVFPRNDVKPNSDSYSFAFESIGKFLSRQRRKPSAEESEKLLDTARMLLTMMEHEGIVPSQHIIRDYVELLCSVGEIRTATELVLESKKDLLDMISSKAIYKVSLANLEQLGNFEMAREIACFSMDNEPMPFLLNKINRREKQSPDHVAWTTDRILETCRKDGRINNRTIFRVAMSNAELQNFDLAREIAHCASKPMPGLLEKIIRKEAEGNSR
jgi:hypothetical protein